MNCTVVLLQLVLYLEETVVNVVAVLPCAYMVHGASEAHSIIKLCSEIVFVT
jgi:hypothetical protein